MRAAGPVVDPVPCSGCGKLIDPLRAGHVAIFDPLLYYFCGRSCREAYLAPFGDAPEAPRKKRRSTPGAAAIRNAHPPVVPEDDLLELPRLDDDRAFAEPIDRPIFSEPPPRTDVEPRDAGALLLLIAVAASGLAVVLGLGGGGRLVLAARVTLAAVGVGMLVARALTTPRDASDAHPVPLLSGPVLSCAVAAWATFATTREVAGEAVALSGTITAAAAVSAWLLEAARRAGVAERSWVQTSLAIPARRLDGQDDDPEDGATWDLRPGEKLLVEPGEDAPVDLVVHEGEVEVFPWLGATTAVRRGPGAPVVAGARVLRGKLVGTCTWSGNDRAFARLVLDPRRRVDALAPVARASRSLAERWAAPSAIAGAALTFAITKSSIDAAMTLVAVLAGLSTPVLATLASVYIARGVFLAQRRGIAYRSADAWDRAARATVALFCARGTLLLGEPEVAEVEPFAKNLDAADLLSLAAGAARADSTPAANGTLRAAKSREVRPDAVRSPNVLPGLGVVAVTSAGEDLSVGSRALMIEQRISIASAESRLSELEALGRSVVLVALSGRLVGAVALQDGIRPGARAAIQHLLDASIEPILMSGDSRETCEAIGRSLDIEHIRAEIVPSLGGEEVKRVAETGARVAVLGHVGLDDAALGAAGVAIALGAAGSASAEHEIALASDDLRDAALSLAIAKRTRVEARVGFALSAIPPAVGVLVVALGVLPPAFVPIAGLIGGVMGVLHGRATSRG